MSLTEVRVSNNHQDPVSLFKIESVDAGDLRYHSFDDDNVVHLVRGYGRGAHGSGFSGSGCSGSGLSGFG